MKFSYRLSKVCGNVFENGNLCFTPDGNTVLSPVGNRVSVFDLVRHTTSTIPFENKKNIKRIAISNNGRFLVTIDIDGHALFINFPRRVILHRFHFKRKVYDIKFSPNDEYFAVTFGNGCQIWKTPSVSREFAPLTFCRTFGGHHDDVVTLDWSEDSGSVVIGSKDMSARVFYRVTTKKMSKSVLSGHRDRIMGTFYSKSSDDIFTIAQDGAVFSWRFDYANRIVLDDNGNVITKDIDSDSSSNSDEEEDGAILTESKTLKTMRGGQWQLIDRTFLWEAHTRVSAVDFNKNSNLLVIGFDNGVYGLYEMPGCVNIHKLSVSNQSINTVSINSTGEWLALGSAAMGQLLVWEWKSESYVIKQQGHLYGLNSVDFSSDGQFIATGGEDSKLKLWGSQTGFCFITFTDHIAPITGVKFIGNGNGKAVISSSLDGTIRAYDLLRYKNFKTLTTPTPVQFTCLAVDSSDEMVCAGSLDPFNIYVWALQTGQLLDVLSGHEGPIACLDFVKGTGSTLASGSWDGTLKLWNIYKNECMETLEHGCDVLAVAFRPDGKEICTATTNGIISLWDVENGTLVGTIEGRRDIAGGRKTTDAMTSDTSAKSKYFNTLVYTPDGNCILAGGKSKYVCLYATVSRTLIKKFQLSHNRSIEGILDELRSSDYVDGVSLPQLNSVVASGYDSDSGRNVNQQDDVSNLPGAGKGSSRDGSRNTLPEILTAAVCFSTTGREWAAATTQGLQIFSLDNAMLFAPSDLDINITPQSIDIALSELNYGLALNMALHLTEAHLLKKVMSHIPMSSIELVVKSVNLMKLKELIVFLSEEIAASPHVEYYLKWCSSLLNNYYNAILRSGDLMSFGESIRSTIRAISVREKDILKMTDENHYALRFLNSQQQSFEGQRRESAPDAVTDVDDNSSSFDRMEVEEEMEARGRKVVKRSSAGDDQRPAVGDKNRESYSNSNSSSNDQYTEEVKKIKKQKTKGDKEEEDEEIEIVDDSEEKKKKTRKGKNTSPSPSSESLAKQVKKKKK